MAEIFVARQVGAHGFDKLVALKLVREDMLSEHNIREMFRTEACTSALLNHPNIVQTFDVGEHDDRPYIAMEFISGEPLTLVWNVLYERLGAFPSSLAAWICKEVAEALHYAHTLSDHSGTPLQLVHRDVSLSNIMLTQSGQVKLLDFGLAKVSTSASITRSGTLKGKLSYASPEQTRAESLDGRSDVFSLGVVLWQLLTGARAFVGSDLRQVMRRIQDEDLPPPSKLGADCSGVLDAIVSKAVFRTRSKRFQTARELADALGRYLTSEHLGYDPEEHVRELMKTYFSERPRKLNGLISLIATGQDVQALAPHCPPDSWLLPSLSSVSLPSDSLQNHEARASSHEAEVVTTADSAKAIPKSTRSRPSGISPRSWVLRVIYGGVSVLLVTMAVTVGLFLTSSDSARLILTSEPAGALVLVDGNEQGRTPIEVEVQVNETVQFALSLRGFEPAYDTVRVASREQTVHTKLIPTPIYGTVVVQSSPQGAEVLVDGLPTHSVTPDAILGLWVGEPHTFIVTHSGFAPSLFEADFGQDLTQEIEVSLVPTKSAFVLGLCSPSPCTLRINGRDVGTSEGQLYEVAADMPVSVKLMRDGESIRSEIYELNVGELGIIREFPLSR